jgi:hypothetical protein
MQNAPPKRGIFYFPQFVMAGLVPAIHVSLAEAQ